MLGAGLKVKRSSISTKFPRSFLEIAKLGQNVILYVRTLKYAKVRHLKPSLSEYGAQKNASKLPCTRLLHVMLLQSCCSVAFKHLRVSGSAVSAAWMTRSQESALPYCNPCFMSLQRVLNMIGGRQATEARTSRRCKSGTWWSVCCCTRDLPASI